MPPIACSVRDNMRMLLSHLLHGLPNRLPCALLLALSLVLAGGCQRGTPAGDPAVTEDDAITAAAPAEPVFDSRLSLVNNNGVLRLDGRVDSDATRERIMAAVEAAYPDNRARGEVGVDGNARATPWADGLDRFLPGFDVPGAALRFEADTIELSGNVPMDARLRLRDSAAEAFPTARLTGLFESADSDSADPAIAGLAALTSESTATQLESALNGIAVQFEPGSARIDAGSLSALSEASQAIASMPAGRRIEISSGGTPEADPTLARQRAEAVKVQLIVNGANPGQIETRVAGMDTGSTGQPASVTFRVLD